MENKIININSLFRDKNLFSNSGKFSINLNETFKNIVYIKVSSLEVPFVFHSILENNNNNKFKIIVKGNSHEIIMGDGNYTSNTLIQFIAKKLEDINTSSINIEFDINVINGKFYFRGNVDFSLDFSRTGNQEYEGFKYYMGYSEDYYTGQQEYNAESVVNVNPLSYFFLKINDIENISDLKVSNAFTKITTGVGIYNYIFVGGTDYNSKDKVFRSPINLSKFDFELVDYLGNEINLFNNDFSFTLELGYIYDKKLYQEINNRGIPNGDIRLKFFY